MPPALNVDPESLLSSGAVVDGQSQRIFAVLSSADATVDDALTGWVGLSRTALADRAARWISDTASLSARLYSHGESLRISGVSFAGMDHDHAEVLAAVGIR